MDEVESEKVDAKLPPLPVVVGFCPMPDIAALIGGKWKLIILQILIFDGTKRFGELKREVNGITQTMLTAQLRALESDGLVHRELYAQVPPKVEYSATQRAKDLEKVFLSLHDWWVASTQCVGVAWSQ
ncbi:winged helix-turn-helix transcriptional regulator [Maritalea porphyrae]|uniref:winged helix-turn-helix transcriptional regulator n=1 Tax=Maritalea porphyrae TaxID=880732 RepID=UPI0022AF1553|nr:helix-turn-helix domain-containing protein [Maritalea porphyrae]MCZ4274135.1 helix-turn-helix domain-containing protein [Maritalea porphyrae]